MGLVRLTFTSSPFGGGDFGKESVVHRLPPPLPLLPVPIATKPEKSHPRCQVATEWRNEWTLIRYLLLLSER